MQNRSILAIVFAMGGVLAGCAGESGPERAAREQHQKDMGATAAAEVGVKRLLKDPESAQFQNERLVTTGAAPVLCGEVNSRNEMGGYTGYLPFVAGGDAAVVSGGLLNSSDFAKLWEMSCSGANKTP